MILVNPMRVRKSATTRQWIPDTAQLLIHLIDSLAAQMSALKSGQPLSPGANKRRSKKAKEEESEDESDTEGEAGDNTSETNTVCWLDLVSMFFFITRHADADM